MRMPKWWVMSRALCGAGRTVGPVASDIRPYFARRHAYEEARRMAFSLRGGNAILRVPARTGLGSGISLISGKTPTMANRLPLEGFKVIDLTAHRAGPTAVRQLADWGAEV